MARWRPERGLLVAAAAWLLAPACGSSGDAGGSSGGAGGSSSEGGKGGGLELCGNGVIDAGEDCDGKDVGGKTCEEFGLASGKLACNAFCHLVATSCPPHEVCNNSDDDDGDGKVDCEDPDCKGEPACSDSCVDPLEPVVPGAFFPTLRGKASSLVPSCSPTSGRELVYRFTASHTGTLEVSAQSSGDVGVSVRTACADAESELACVNEGGPGATEVLLMPVTEGSSYDVILDAIDPGFAGEAFIDIDAPVPEAFCDNFVDDDGNGRLDCDDLSCQTMPDCEPGAKATGKPCSANHQCFANEHDPICLAREGGFPLTGYCSEFCDLVLDDCSGDALCFDLGISENGVCLDGCEVDEDCAGGLSCLDNSLATKVCLITPEADCVNALDDDFNKLVDCEDPTCQATEACVPGALGTGEICTKNSDCQANANDPLCLKENIFTKPFFGGYCSQFCETTADDCPPGSVCADVESFPSGRGQCLLSCSDVSECREGYDCTDLGLATSVCM